MAYRMSPPNNETLDIMRKYGDHFLGFYAYDELGGRQLDQAQDYITVPKADSYSDASTKFVGTLNSWLRSGLFRFTRNYAFPTEFPLVTSDYALYWYDFKAGYDIVFAEFGWNYSRTINIALTRGAATAQNKEWGVIITHTYTAQPYLESGPELYQDMLLAYQSGAKYIIVFDSNVDWTQGTLKAEHLEAMKQFWQYAQDNPRPDIPIGDRVAYVLREDYAYGFRGPTDKIWGLWEADSIASDLSMGVGYLLTVYGKNLDIIYEDAIGSTSTNGYLALIYWNDSRIFPTQQPTLSPQPSQDPTPTPQASSSATPSPNQTGSTKPSSTPSPSPFQNTSPSPTLEPTPTLGLSKYLILPIEYIGIVLAGILVAAAIAITVLLKRKRINNRK